MKNTDLSSAYICPVIPSRDIERDLAWYKEKTGFELAFKNEAYAGIKRAHLRVHLQWHAGTASDPIIGSVVKFFVDDVQPIFEEFLARGTVKVEKLQERTPWGTKEFGFYDLNKNLIYFVQNL